MGGLPPDSRYITGGVPSEMREGVEITEAEVAPATGLVEDVDGTPTQITRIRIPRPPDIPAGPPRFTQLASNPGATAINAPGFLQYDFPLLPGVQCKVMLQGEPTAAHLEQLCDYLQVACKRLRQQEADDRNTATHIAFLEKHAPKRGRKVKNQSENGDGRESIE